jgi:hypothetical protein
VDAAIIQVKVSSTSMRISPFWKDFLDKRYHDIIHEVLRIKTTLRSHEINNVEFVYSPYYRQHELSRVDLLPHALWHIFTAGTPFCGLLSFKGKPTLITRHNVTEVAHLLSFWQR